MSSNINQKLRKKNSTFKFVVVIKCYIVFYRTTFSQNITHFLQALFGHREIINKIVHPDETDRTRNRIFE